jgi:hypothetical protein
LRKWPSESASEGTNRDGLTLFDFVAADNANNG